jgi:hypothetical protein
MKKNYHYQLGYGGLEMLLGGAIIGAIAYFFFYPMTFRKPLVIGDTASCYIDPATSTRSFEADGKTYVLIKSGAVTIRSQVDYHFSKLGEVKIAHLGNKTFSYYNVWLDTFSGPPPTTPAKRGNPGRLEGGTYRPTTGADHLRFVDVSSTYPLLEEGYAMLDIYLEKGQQLPQFIQNYCNDQMPTTPLFLVQDTMGKSFPPIEINSGPLSEWTPGAGDLSCTGDCLYPRPNERYRIFAYEKRTTPSYSTAISPTITGKRKMTITVDNTSVTYDAYYLSNSASEMITLIPSDPNAADADLAYKYTPLFNVPFLPTPVDLHKKSPLEVWTQHLEAFVPYPVPPWGWWTPECKPAVYLYPQKDTVVNVKVNIKNGFLTYTDPLYPKDTGWSVLAKPNGDLAYLNHHLADSHGEITYPTGVFPYLYYEGKVQDNAIEKPTTGFVKPYNQLPTFFDDVLPELGLNATEATEFKKYWLKALPKSPYYFIGIIPQDKLNQQEPLTITPKQDSMIRVRLYFEALAEFKQVDQPTIQTPQRNGFTVVDWGGMVKRDKAHPFTCLQ